MRDRLFLIGTLAAIGVTAFATMRAVQRGSGFHEAASVIAKDAEDIFTDEAALRRYVQTYGPQATVERLHALVPRFGSCHNPAHVTGRFAYEFHGDRTFQLCRAECHSGCYHGATEAYFREHGTADLTAQLEKICNSAENPFFSHQCIHGVGHGLMAWTNYGLSEALRSCDLLPQGQDSCWTGVFMENIVAGLAGAEHPSRYVNSDPHYPCTIVEEKYKSSCYFLQPTRVLQLFPKDFSAVVRVCLETPAVYQRVCFESMGREVGGAHRNDPVGSIAACGAAPFGEHRIHCLRGAVQDGFWDPSGQETTLAFCGQLSAVEERAACFQVIADRAPDILSGAPLETFCERLDPAYRAQCLESQESAVEPPRLQ